MELYSCTPSNADPCPLLKVTTIGTLQQDSGVVKAVVAWSKE